MDDLAFDQTKFVQTFASGTRLVYKKGAIIIRPEDTPQGIFYIESGYVKTYAITKYGEENLLIIRHSGEVFPMIWAVADDQASVFYEAITETVLFRISREKYLQEIKSDTDFADVVLQQAVEMYRVHAERVNNLGFRTAAERVAYRLLTLAKRFGEDSSAGGSRIMVPLRQQDIAASVRISRETASRELAKLERRKLIKSEDGYIIVLDKDGLRKFVQ